MLRRIIQDWKKNLAKQKGPSQKQHKKGQYGQAKNKKKKSEMEK